ncbi:MAG: SDR family oxidoreductase [Chloroflexi bacterium]|nr:SDR family oxidoreductase [Chloroflexota bacterium]
MGSFDGQVVVIFGASSGIGRAAAQAFAEGGATVALAARRGSTLAEMAGLMAASGYHALALPTDVSHRDQVDHTIATTIERLGRLDVVVNAAGLNTQHRRISDLTQGDWDHVLSVNLTGAFNTTQAALPQMRAQGGGLIVQFSSVSGRWGDMSGAAYQASKHGIVGLCQATMMEERTHGIRVTAILPGLVDTPLLEKRPVPPTRETLEKALQPRDVAMACTFLASLPARAYIPELIMMPPQLQVVGQAMI